jgi:hypothetical protein
VHPHYLPLRVAVAYKGQANPAPAHYRCTCGRKIAPIANSTNSLKTALQIYIVDFISELRFSIVLSLIIVNNELKIHHLLAPSPQAGLLSSSEKQHKAA